MDQNPLPPIDSFVKDICRLTELLRNCIILNFALIMFQIDKNCYIKKCVHLNCFDILIRQKNVPISYIYNYISNGNKTINSFWICSHRRTRYQNENYRRN